MKKQTGFTIIETLLTLLVAAVIGFGGYYVWNTQQKTDKTLNTSQSTEPKADKKTAAAAKDPLIFQDSVGAAYEIAVLAKTADQKGQANAIDKKCQGDTKSAEAVGVTGTRELFTDANNYVVADNFAKINAGCYDKKVGGAQWGGGANHFIQKKNGTWMLLVASQGVIGCDVLDGTGIPSSMVSACEQEDGTLRAPKQ